MISTRIIDILRTPDTIVAEDILLLEKEIKAYPYVQSLRALHLLGMHKFYPDNFQKVLSETAAYTTDKKILYQLINKKPLVPTPVPFVEEKIEVVEEESPETLNLEETNNGLEKTVVSDAELVEEEALAEEADVSSMVEYDEVTVQDVELEEEVVSEEILFESLEEPLEEIAEEELINSTSEMATMEEESVEVVTDTFAIETIEEKTDDAELSFHGMDEFLPDVKIEANYSEISAPEIKETDNTQLSPEDEMKRLIEAVELKMKETKKEAVKEEDDWVDFDGEINFGEGYIEPNQDTIEEIKLNNSEEIVSSISEQILETEITKSEPVTSTWKPLHIEANVPDALLAKPKERETEAVLVEEKTEKTEKTVDVKAQEAIVKDVEHLAPLVEETMNTLPKPTLSAFPESSTGISSVQPTDSNVPSFIDTWQSWLKIDRVEPSKQEADAEEIKNQAIETFIENEPRISQLKDEVTFVVKEKSDDISHLMTETLARLYIEQKLYTKAIKSFKILIDKHPEKEAYYKEVIKEIKEMRPRF